ncbi:hypothetical protein DAPPUDRAFT_249439 [Daphnia pulex]|uniref:Uncharacterized protein n=1 Tax=Daphnia pulex TaxID=6669 RepID=E9GWN6_DAPPU|nr:hypothetical protein DAPPUDRAFT_249439 [Daphnia pulex]|eukprot:EFX76146.1 hypothetical protein DAPPUDRAFT_249439 [Daphnia pulex]
MPLPLHPMKNYEPEKRYEHTHQDTKGRTYRYDAKINYEEHHHDPEVEILGSKIDPMQMEMKLIREEIGLMKPLEEKVKDLKTTVRMIEGTLSVLEGGQKTTYSKLDKPVQLMTKNLPSTEEDGMNTHEPDPNALTR